MKFSIEKQTRNLSTAVVVIIKGALFFSIYGIPQVFSGKTFALHCSKKSE